MNKNKYDKLVMQFDTKFGMKIDELSLKAGENLLAHHVWDWIERELMEKDRVILTEIEKSRGNDYHNIGMGELDYHEKCAVDAYIETLKHRINPLPKEKKR